MIASSTNRKLKQNIAKVLKNKPRILINTNGRVTQVNQYSVVDNNGVYVILDKEFTLKKTAVAYAIALVNGDSTLQNTIEQLNWRISKYAEDTQMYKQHIRKNPKKLYLYARISDSVGRINCLNIELTKTLKSIKIA
jgi:hypothetical protein